MFDSTILKTICKRLDLVLQRMAETGLKLKPEKCQLLKPEVTFLGHLVSYKGIQPNPDNIAKSSFKLKSLMVCSYTELSS
jgi:hypothetical protein